MLDREYKFYKQHQEELIKKYRGKVLVIRGDEITGVFDNEEEAYRDAKSKFELGSFLIQRCIPEKEGIQSFHSRVVLL